MKESKLLEAIRLIDEADSFLSVAEHLLTDIDSVLSAPEKLAPEMELQLLTRLIELYYNNVESFLIHAHKVFGNGIERESWHKNLIYTMSCDRPDRPAIISNTAFHALDEIRGYRHFARYNYRIERYDRERIDRILQMVRKSCKVLRIDLMKFQDFLRLLSQEESE